MLRMFLIGLLLTGTASAQGPFNNAQANSLKKETPTLQSAIDAAVSSVGTGVLLEQSRGAYLDGYGMVITLRIALSIPRGPFNAVSDPADIKKLVADRRKEIDSRLITLLKERVGTMDSIGPSESVAIVVFITNYNPADVPTIPSHVVFSVKKKDVLDYAGKISELAIHPREFQ